MCSWVIASVGQLYRLLIECGNPVNTRVNTQTLQMPSVVAELLRWHRR